jgi:uncharacterized protein YndB with AHSA1/START domain
MIVVTHEIHAVERVVSGRTLPAGEARVVSIRRTYDTTVEDLWEACTDAERIPRWFLPVSGELRLGGRYQLEGNAGGTIETCEPPHRFTATWEYDGDVTWIEVTVSEADGGGAELLLEHIAHVDDARWLEFGPGAVGVGWDLGLLGLTLHLASGGGQVDAADVQAWMAGPEGREYLVGSSERWGAAHLAAGADPEVAAAATARTTAAYTGEG